MAKKSTNKESPTPKENQESPSLRWPLYIILLVLLGTGSWWLWRNSTEIREVVYHYVENGDILTLESKYTPESIMDAHYQELIGNEKRTYQEAASKYYPYLLLEVKYYTEDKKSREGVILWGMDDGEIVLNTETWDTTHGFQDCLDCDASRNDFKIIYALAKHQGELALENLQKELHIERDQLDAWIEGARSKHLIIQKGPLVQLHFENPKILIFPQTQIKQHLVSKPIINTQRVAKKYSRNQIIKMANTAFGSDFTIRSEQEIFLPAYSIQVLNADGSLYISDWNAITGQRIKPKYFSSGAPLTPTLTK